jgi:NitT/TauT family transport system ATP-binding protein
MNLAGPRAAAGNRRAIGPRRTAPPRTAYGGGAVRLDGVSRVYGRGRQALRALDNVCLTAAPGEFVCLLGASGCGKSTLLALVTGLDLPSAGSVTVPGRSTLMFQEPALFPWLTAARNVELGLHGSGMTGAQRRERARELLATVHLGGLGSKRPHELSGGMRQRVALARALAQEVDVLAMDEPFGALDAMTRDLLHDELERIWQDRRLGGDPDGAPDQRVVPRRAPGRPPSVPGRPGQAAGARRCAGEAATAARSTQPLTVLFVTHNVREAVRLGDKVVLLSSRPGTVIEEYPVEVARPRRIESPEVSGLAAQITERLRAEVLRHAG